MNKNITTSIVNALVSKLRDILDNHDYQLKHTESLEVISKFGGAADWNTYSAHLKTLEPNPENKNPATSSDEPSHSENSDDSEILYCSFLRKIST